MLNRIKKRHIALLVLLAVAAVATVFYLRTDQNGNLFVVRPYDQEKDFHALVKLMNDNKYWISERPDFSPEKTLLLRAPRDNPDLKGSVKINVVEAEDKTGGFIAYHKKAPDHGFIWLLAVDKYFRGRGFGEKLMTSALEEFKSQGVSYVTLMTRLHNKPAIALYRKLGFTEKYREEDRGLIFMIKRNL